MAYKSLDTTLQDLGIEVGDTPEKLPTTTTTSSSKYKSLDDTLTSLDITLKPPSTTQQTEPARRGILEWLQTGEYAGVGLLDSYITAAKQLTSGKTSGEKLSAASALMGHSMIKSIYEGVKEKKELSSTVERETGSQLTKGQEFGVDIAQMFVDPTLYFSLGLSKLPKLAAKYGTKIPGVGKVLEKGIDAVGETFVFQYKAPAEYKKAAAERLVRIARGQESAEEMAKALSRMPGKKFGKYGRKLTIAEQQTLGDIITGQVTNADPILMQIAEPAIQALQKLGKEAVDTGLMTADTFLERAGKYMPRLYRKTELVDRLSQFYAKTTKIKAERFLPRKDISEEAQQAMGVIKEAAYPVAKGIRDLTADIETVKLFKWVGEKYGKTQDDVTQFGIEGLEKLPDSKSLGDLAGKYVPKSIANDLNQLIKPKGGKVIQAHNTLLNAWKTGKTVLSPSYHMRNAVSNFILNDLSGVNVFDPRGMKAYGEAVRALKQGADKSTFLKEAKDSGLLGKTFYGQELKDFIDPLDTSNVTGLLSWTKNMAKKTAQLGGDFQGTMEDMSKLAHFIYQRNRGKSIDEATASAKRALFDYGELTSVEQKIKKVIPFYTFNRKAFPLITQIAVDSPGRIGKYAQFRDAVETYSGAEDTEEERRYMADWLKNKFTMRLPFKNKAGESLYFDVTYIFPYADTLGNFTNEGMNGVVKQFMLMTSPFILEPIQQFAADRDFYMDEQISMMKNDKAFGVLPVGNKLAHAIRTFAPSVVNDFGEKLVPLIKGTSTYSGGERDVAQTIANSLGLKTFSYDETKSKASLPYELSDKISPIDENIRYVTNDKSITEEERARQLEYWNKKRAEILSKYPEDVPAMQNITVPAKKQPAPFSPPPTKRGMFTKLAENIIPTIKKENTGPAKKDPHPYVTTRIEDDFPFPDFDTSHKGEVLRADLLLLNPTNKSQKYNIKFHLVSPDNKEYVFDQTEEAVEPNPDSPFYGLELRIPEDAEPGEYEVYATVNGQEVPNSRNPHTIVEGVVDPKKRYPSS